MAINCHVSRSLQRLAPCVCCVSKDKMIYLLLGSRARGEAEQALDPAGGALCPAGPAGSRVAGGCGNVAPRSFLRGAPSKRSGVSSATLVTGCDLFASSGHRKDSVLRGLTIIYLFSGHERVSVTE